MLMPRKTWPEEVFSRIIQDPFSENGPGWVYLVPTDGMSRGLVNCQSARPTITMRRIETRILALAPIARQDEPGSRSHLMRCFPLFYEITCKMRPGPRF